VPWNTSPVRGTASLPESQASARARVRLSADAVTRLLERAAAGDERAWRALVEEFGGLVWAITRAHRLSDADAADVTQVTFMRLVEHLDRLRDPARVGAWLATTARRECLVVLRQRARVIPWGDELPELMDGPEHSAALIAQERDATLWTAFERLRPSDRALLRMLVVDPAPSYDEIIAALEMPVGSIGPTRARAVQRGSLKRTDRSSKISAVICGRGPSAATGFGVPSALSLAYRSASSSPDNRRDVPRHLAHRSDTRGTGMHEERTEPSGWPRLSRERHDACGT
jgi:RNA polymerase sigma factor (sigma-70 family)